MNNLAFLEIKLVLNSMKNALIFLILLSGFVNAQETYERKSEDGKVLAENFIAFDEGIDSVIIKNRKHKFKFSYHEPFINIKDDEGYNLIDNSIVVNRIKKIKKKTYLIVAYGGNLSLETELNLFIIKKNKILKYYVVQSNNKRLRDVSFEYLPKTKEVIIPISKRYTPQDYIYDIDLKQNKLDSIKPLTKKPLDTLFYHYKLKIE